MRDSPDVPAADDDRAELFIVSELGRFSVPRGKQHGQVSVRSSELVRFLNSDTNEVVTLIVVRKTREKASGGLVHGFANHRNSTAPPPTLLINTK